MVSQRERERILREVRGARVSDICDGMDAIGCLNQGNLDREIRPLWKDLEGFAHRIYGFAHTVRFVPTNRAIPAFNSREEFYRWMENWYTTLADGPIVSRIRPGDVVVIDGELASDCGFIGSNNSLQWYNAGAVGVVTNGGARDTDEISAMQIPVYSRGVARGIRPGRLELESTGARISVGGVSISPGDLIVADGDGVIAVPCEHVEDVVQVAVETQKGDVERRIALYEAAGRERDRTLASGSEE
jgi:regulator of RNase E activity RraA